MVAVREDTTPNNTENNSTERLTQQKKTTNEKTSQRVLESKLLLEKKTCRELRYWFKPSLTHHIHHLPIITRLFLQEHPDIASALVRVCFSDLSRDKLTLVGGDEMLAIRYIGIL